jgi:hypothetical protein
MMHGREKSGLAIVAMKPPNEAGLPVEEVVERRAEATGNAGHHHTPRTQGRASVELELDRVRYDRRQRFAVTHPWWEPYAGKPHVRCCAGGGQ